MPTPHGLPTRCRIWGRCSSSTPVRDRREGASDIDERSQSGPPGRCENRAKISEKVAHTHDATLGSALYFIPNLQALRGFERKDGDEGSFSTPALLPPPLTDTAPTSHRYRTDLSQIPHRPLTDTAPTSRSPPG